MDEFENKINFNKLIKYNFRILFTIGKIKEFNKLFDL